MSVIQLPTITRSYHCQYISEVTDLVQAASKLRAMQITVIPKPDSIQSLWRWEVVVEMAGDER